MTRSSEANAVGACRAIWLNKAVVRNSIEIRFCVSARANSAGTRVCWRGDADDGGAVEQSAPDLERGGIEGGIGGLRDAVIGSDVDVVGVAHEANDGAVRDNDTFGLAGGAGGVHEVGGRVGGSVGEIEAECGEGCGKLVDEDDGSFRGGGGRATGGIGRVCDDGADTGIGQHVCDPIERVGGIEGKIGSACLEGGQHGDNEGGGTVHEDGHPLPRPRGPAGAQMVSQVRGGGVQLGVGERIAGVGDGEGLRAGSGLLGEQSGHRGIARKRSGGVVPLRDDLVMLGGRQQVEFAQALAGLIDERGKDALVQLHPVGDGFRAEQVRREFGLAGQAAFRFE